MQVTAIKVFKEITKLLRSLEIINNLPCGIRPDAGSINSLSRSCRKPKWAIRLYNICAGRVQLSGPRALIPVAANTASRTHARSFE